MLPVRTDRGRWWLVCVWHLTALQWVFCQHFSSEPEVCHRNLQRETSWLSWSQIHSPQAWPAWPIMDLRVGTLNGIKLLWLFSFYVSYNAASYRKEGSWFLLGRDSAASCCEALKCLSQAAPGANVYFAKMGSLKRKILWRSRYPRIESYIPVTYFPYPVLPSQVMEVGGS